jgi:sirohydrochlorin cobaltochelatase
LDDPRNQDGIGERELLAVSFGTSFPDSREQDIGAMEAAMANAFPAWSVRRAFTSGVVLRHILTAEGEIIDSVPEALARAKRSGVKTLVVQPTHLMAGREYEKLRSGVLAAKGDFPHLSLGRPLLSDEADFEAFAKIAEDIGRPYFDGQTALCLMGHGTDADANGVYEKLQTYLTGKPIYIGTVESEPSLLDLVRRVRAGSWRRAVLAPLMIVAGNHAHNDMAGPWKRAFEDAGYETVCLEKGLGRRKEIGALLARHAQAAMEKINGV